MIIQIILTGAILGICYRFLAAPHSSQTQAWKKMLLILFTSFAVVVIFFPDITNRIAHLLGIGRGADLLLYALTVAFLFQQLSGYVKRKDEQRRVAVLARRIAILEANDAYPIKK